MKRFQGAIVALTLFLVVFGLWWWTAPQVVNEDYTPTLFTCEKPDVVRVRIERPDRTLELVQADGRWSLAGLPWRPSRSMVRRIAHQICNLKARARVVDAPSRPEEYGLGSSGIRVTIGLKDGREIAFLAGDPNPTGVSYYVQPLPAGQVFIVQKAAMDYYDLTLEEFRERKFAVVDADDARAIDAEIDGQHLRFERLPDGPDTPKAGDWRMTQPASWSAGLDAVRTMLGRLGSAKAESFVEDEPKDLSKYGLDKPKHRLVVTHGSGETVSVRVGAPVPGGAVDGVALSYVYREEDDAVYASKTQFLEAYQRPLVAFRNPEIIDAHDWDLTEFTVSYQDKVLALTRTADGWRWPDQAPVSGSTPSRLAGSIAEIDALAFHEVAVPAAGLDRPFATFKLKLAAREVSLVVGAEVPGSASLPQVVPPPLPPPAPGMLPHPTPQPMLTTRRYAQVLGDPVVYEVGVQALASLDDLFREYARKGDQDRDKQIRDAAGLPPAAPPKPLGPPVEP
jgi:hypothetical protein